MAFDIHAHWQTLRQLLADGTPFVVVTLTGIRGSAPQVTGAKIVINANGPAQGTVGGGRVEAAVIRHAVELLSQRTRRSCEHVTWNLQTDIGMTCGGEVSFLFEVHQCSDWKVAVYGAGHIAQALIPMLLNLECRVTCVDQRQEWLARLPDHERLSIIHAPELPAALSQLDPGSFFVLMTQGHATDLPVLKEILTSLQPPYVGVLGSQQKAGVLRRELAEAGFDEQQQQSFFCPMGLSMGNNTPPEIAVSILAQLIQERDRLAIVDQKTKQF